MEPNNNKNVVALKDRIKQGAINYKLTFDEVLLLF